MIWFEEVRHAFYSSGLKINKHIKLYQLIQNLGYKYLVVKVAVVRIAYIAHLSIQSTPSISRICKILVVRFITAHLKS